MSNGVDLLGVNVGVIKTEDAVNPALPHSPIPVYRITRIYHSENKVGVSNSALAVSVTQKGKDAAWALELADRAEFHAFNNEWICTKTIIVQTGME
jgi:hypothetical protein